MSSPKQRSKGDSLAVQGKNRGCSTHLQQLEAWAGGQRLAIPIVSEARTKGVLPKGEPPAVYPDST